MSVSTTTTTTKQHDASSSFYHSKLDQEFSQILALIKPYIRHINSPHYLNQCCIWLRKLSRAHTSEKIRRNQYLIQLANQVQDGVLREPFTKMPPPNALLSLDKYSRISSHQNVVVKCDASENNNTKRNNKKQQQHHLTNNKSLNCEPKNNNKSPINDFTSYNWGSSHQHPTINNDQIVQLLKFQTNDWTNQTTTTTAGTDSSWFDLSESNNNNHSVSVLASGDRSGKSIKGGGGDEDGDEEDVLKSSKMKFKDMHELEGQQQCSMYSMKYQKEKQQYVNKMPIDDDCQCTTSEVRALKHRLKDLLDVKVALKDTYYSTEDWKLNMDSIKLTLAKTRQQNKELQNTIEMNDLEIKKHLEEEKRHFETRLAKITCQNQLLIDEKDEEIRQLREINAKQCVDHIPQRDDERVISLKQCLSKMARLYKKSETEYFMEAEQMREQIDRLQVKLQTQKAELLTSITATKQMDFDKALVELEGKYRELFEKYCTMQPSLSDGGMVNCKKDEPIILEIATTANT